MAAILAEIYLNHMNQHATSFLNGFPSATVYPLRHLDDLLLCIAEGLRRQKAKDQMMTSSSRLVFKYQKLLQDVLEILDLVLLVRQRLC